jgi:hypothetical protein
MARTLQQVMRFTEPALHGRENWFDVLSYSGL